MLNVYLYKDVRRSVREMGIIVKKEIILEYDTVRKLEVKHNEI